MKTTLCVASIVLTLASCGGDNHPVPNGQGSSGPEDTACIEIYAPVCAKSEEAVACVNEPCPTHQYTTFSNSCYAEQKNALQSFSGECGSIENRFSFEDKPLQYIVESGDDIDKGADTTIVSSSIENDVLKLDVNYGGGCDTHEFSLISAEPFMESNPVQLELILQHKTDDACEAIISEKLSFDILPLQEIYYKSYQVKTGEIIIRVQDEVILYSW